MDGQDVVGGEKSRCSRCAWICVYAAVNARCEKGKEGMMKFCQDVNEFITKTGRGEKVVLVGDRNGMVRSTEIADEVEKQEVIKMDENASTWWI